MLSKISNSASNHLSYALERLGIKSHFPERPTASKPCPRCGLEQPALSEEKNACPSCKKNNGMIYFVPTKGNCRRTSLIPSRNKNLIVSKFPKFEDSSDVDRIHEAIEEYCRQTGHSFIDDSFPHSARSIGDLSKMPKLIEKMVKIIWLRPSKIYTKDYQVFSWKVFDDPRPTDIEQGRVGDCWLLSSLATVSERPEILKEIVLTPEYNPAGIYKIRLCIDGFWETIIVDDFFPCYAVINSMVFAVGRRKQLWVSLIEKALAKFYGSYSNLVAGRAAESLSMLTGALCEQIDLEADVTMPPPDAFAANELVWARLLSARDANYLMGCGCGSAIRNIPDEEYKNVGLLPGHGYSILDVRQLGVHRLLKIRNPWGNFIWLGEWSNTWPGWTPEAKAALDFDKTKTEEGTFWIPFDQFLLHFDSVEIAIFNPNWFSQRFKFEINWPQASVMKVTVRESTEMCFGLFRRHARKSEDEVDLLILVHREEKSVRGRPGELIAKSKHTYYSWVKTEDKFFEPGTYIVCAISFKDFCENKKYPATLVVHSGKPVEAKMEDAAPNVLKHSLMQMTLKEKLFRSFPNGRIYRSQNTIPGGLLMVDNLDITNSVWIKMDCRGSVNIVSSRGEMVVADCVPPLCRQIIIVLTAKKADELTTTNDDIQLCVTKQNAFRYFAVNNPRSLHEPAIDDSGIQSVLHGPEPLHCIFNL